MPVDEPMGEPESPEVSSAYPPGWPGISGRSREHEASPRGGPPSEEDPEVTKAQRRLELSISIQLL